MGNDLSKTDFDCSETTSTQSEPNNDFGYGKEGSVVVYGDVEYCYNPCDENSNSTNDNCNWCDPQSTLIMDFERCVLCTAI